MGLCAKDARRKRPFKTIIIPRGLINPNENNIIEIPLNLDTNSSLIVKAPTDANSSFSVEPFRGGPNKIPSPNETIPSYLIPPPGYPDNQPRNVNYQEQYVQPSRNVSCQDTYMQPTPQPMPNYNCDTRCDFGCQFPQSSTAMPHQSSRPMMNHTSYQPTPNLSQMFHAQSSRMQFDYHQPTTSSPAHSPLCPICSRASCKYLSSSGINRASGRPFCSFSPALKDTSVQSDYKPRSDFPFSCFPEPKTDILAQSRERMDSALISRILDDKLDKVLKPFLTSMRKCEDDEREIETSRYHGSYCTPKFSHSSIEPKHSRDYCLSGRYDEYKTRPSYFADSSRRTMTFADFEQDLKRRRDDDYTLLESTHCTNTCPKYSTPIASSSLRRPSFDTEYRDTSRLRRSSFDDDHNASRIRRPSFDQDYHDVLTRRKAERESMCLPTASCQRKANVSFTDKGVTADSQLNLKLSNSKLKSSNSGYSLTPRSSF